MSLQSLATALVIGQVAAKLGAAAEVSISMFAGAVPFILMLIVLLVRPMGLMGRR